MRIPQVLAAPFAAAFLFFMLFSSSATAEPDAEVEARLRAQLVATHPELGPVWDEANRARAAQDSARAADKYAEVAEKGDFDAAYRRLCFEERNLGKHDSALTYCRKAMALAPSAWNRAAMATVLASSEFPTTNDLAEATRLVSLASAEAPSDPVVLSAAAQIAYGARDAHRLDRAVDQLVQAAPNSGEAAQWSVLRAVALGRDTSDAAKMVARAEKSGELSHAATTQLREILDKVDAEWTPERAAKTFGVVLVGWLAVLAVLFGAGILLSQATLRATTRIDRTTAGNAVGGTALVKRIYAAVISLASVFFYLSLPLVAVTVLVAAGGAIYFFFALGRIPIKLVLIIAVVALASIWALLKSVYAMLKPQKDEDPGIELDLAKQPRLAGLLDTVSSRIGTRTVDKVFLTATTDLAVFERGGAMKRLRGRAQRCLILGVGLLDGMRVVELKSVLAHEFGHFKNEDTAGGALSLSVRRSMLHLVVNLVKGGAAAWYNPAWLFVRGFHNVFLRISQGASRLQEILADRWAITAYGTQSFVRGFSHVVRRDVEFHHKVQASLREVIEAKAPLANLYAYTPKEIASGETEEKIREVFAHSGDVFDSHPSPKARLSAAEAMSVSAPDEAGDAEPVWSLFDGREELERTLTARVREAVAENHGVHILAEA